MSYTRSCPRCNVTITYTLKRSKDRADTQNTVCKSCSSYPNAPYEKNKKWCNGCKSNKHYNLYYHKKNRLTNLCIDCIKKQVKKSRQKNIEKCKERQRIYHKDNKNARNKYARTWHDQNRVYSNQKSKEWRKNNIERARYLDSKKDRVRRAKEKELNDNQYTLAESSFTIKSFNNQCFNCGNKDDLTIDHHRPLSKGYALSINNAVVLCRSCNSSKGSKNPEQFYGTKGCKILDKKLKKIASLFKK